MTGMAGPPPAKMVPFNSPLFSAAVPSSSNLPHLVVNRLNASTATAARGYIEKDIDMASKVSLKLGHALEAFECNHSAYPRTSSTEINS